MGLIDLFCSLFRRAAPVPARPVYYPLARIKGAVGLFAKSRLDELYPFFEAMFTRFDITTEQRQAYFLAQFAYETDHFCALEEYASGAAYEGRADLGNTQAGDGVRFKGRGLPMLTGRSNYTLASQELFANLELVDHPEGASEPRTAVLLGGWYWGHKALNSLADQADFVGITRKINGGLNGLAGRQALLASLQK